MAAQQNVYNVGYDLAVVLATLGVGLDGESRVIACDRIIADPTGDLTTGKLSLGSKDKGLAIHGKFEADASLTRNDYYTNGGGTWIPEPAVWPCLICQTTSASMEPCSDTWPMNATETLTATVCQDTVNSDTTRLAVSPLTFLCPILY